MLQGDDEKWAITMTSCLDLFSISISKNNNSNKSTSTTTTTTTTTTSTTTTTTTTPTTTTTTAAATASTTTTTTSRTSTTATAIVYDLSPTEELSELMLVKPEAATRKLRAAVSGRAAVAAAGGAEGRRAATGL